MKSKVLSTTILLITLSLSSLAQDARSLRTKQFNLNEGVAISGYDPVEYFKSNNAVKGNKGLSLDQQGAIYYFSSAANREEFRKNPSHYEPEYGGWCAYAMGAKGEKVSVDPETFKIINGKLYLFYNSFFNNTLKSWNKNETNLKANADVNWKNMFH